MDMLHTERREGKFFLPESRTVKDVISALLRLCWHLQTSGAILVVIKDTSLFFLKTLEINIFKQEGVNLARCS